MIAHDPPASGQRFFGVVVGVVTDNQDPEGLGRVRLRFPWLSGEHTSAWARVAAPMAGPSRGAYFLPEVEDEVLVAFEHGRPEFAYVVGSLWNGKDRPPAPNTVGKDQRILRSRSGLQITLDDTAGAEKLELRDRDGKNRIVIDVTAGAITIQSAAELKLVADGKLTLGTASADLDVQCNKFTVTCAELDINNGALEVK